jgi:GNAT superfamily N-acetyltransferase
MPARCCPDLVPDLRLTPAREEDADLLCLLIQELADFENLGSECHISVQAVRDHLLGQRRSAEAVIAWIGGQAAGFAVYYRTFSTFAARPGLFLEDLFVRPEFRRQGIGKSLLKEVGRIAHGMDAGRYEWTTLAWNRNARDLYASMGAREMRDWIILRMEGESLADLACAKHGDEAAGCRCGGKGRHHHSHGAGR